MFSVKNTVENVQASRCLTDEEDRYVRFEVFTAVTMKKAVFWDVAPCSSGVN
jgi:hypothetical protein